ncbi:MAG: F0F1 ATP synthase subunit A, partial [Bacteroidales bacterium]|nr:F0F1 ATP synthase subunit A [Bacteroidales bacterium]
DEGFSPADFIFDHVLDAYEWHILSYDDFHLSIPLPVIIYSESKGLNIFMFSKFHHGHADYKGFRFESHGENKGNIVEVLEDGTTALPKLDLSFTKNVLAILVSLILLLWVFLSVAKAYERRPDKAPTGLQNLIEPIILFIRDDIAKPSIGEHKYERFMPFLLTVFFFILFNNMIGLIPIFPGGANVTGSISVTMVLALFTFVITTINGNRNYWLHIFNMPGVPWWVKFPIPLMPVIEIIGMMTKPFVLMIRLFANITAGHIIVLGFFSLIFIFGEMSVGLGLGISVLSLAFTIFMTMLELLVALIQAYVFTLLSAIYFGMATEEHH